MKLGFLDNLSTGIKIGKLRNKTEYFRKILALGPIAYWPLWDATGSSAAIDLMGLGNGAYSNVTLAQTGIGDGRISASFNGTTSYCDIFSAALAAAFSSAAGTFHLWAKVSAAGVWTDSTTRALFRLLVDGSNYVDGLKTTTNNNLLFRYTAGGTTTQISTLLSPAPTTWVSIAMTWARGGTNELKAFVNGAQVETTQTIAGTWAGTPAATTTCVGAVSTVPASVWSGTIAHAAIWANALTPAQVASLAVV